MCHSDGLKSEQARETVVDGAFSQFCTVLLFALRVPKVKFHRSVRTITAGKHPIAKCLGVHLRVESVRSRAFVYTNLHCCICGEALLQPIPGSAGNGQAFRSQKLVPKIIRHVRRHLSAVKQSHCDWFQVPI